MNKLKKFLCLLLAGSLCSCTQVTPAGQDEVIEEAEASTMKLKAAEGTAHVMDAEQNEMELFEDMNLYSGYGVDTETESYAWVDLDEEKLLVMDEQSSTHLENENRKLKISLDQGSMFFCVTEDLEEDESMEMMTPNKTNMIMSIRGTTGIVSCISEKETKIVLIEGKTEGNGFSLENGETAVLRVDDLGEVHTEVRRTIVSEDFPEYVIREIQENERVREKLRREGIDPDALMEEQGMTIQEAYQDVLDSWNRFISTGEDSPYIYRRVNYYGREPSFSDKQFYALYDLNGDGTDEMIIAGMEGEDDWGFYQNEQIYAYDGRGAVNLLAGIDGFDYFNIGEDRRMFATSGNALICPVWVFHMASDPVSLMITDYLEPNGESGETFEHYVDGDSTTGTYAGTVDHWSVYDILPQGTLPLEYRSCEEPVAPYLQ